MKFAALLAISLPLAAACQTQVLAQDCALSSTGSWLKSSIATLKPAAEAPARRKISHAQPTSVSPIAPEVKLRPFVPHRYLPHEGDLRAEQAQLDNSATFDQGSGGASLSGAIETTATNARRSSAYDKFSLTKMFSMAPPTVQKQAINMAKQALGTRAPRLMPGQTPMMPEQLTRAPAAAVQPMIPEPQQFQQRCSQRPVVSPSFETMHLSEEEQTALERLVAQNKPTAVMDFNGDVIDTAQDNPSHGRGPASVPLNLFGGNAMQMLRGSHRQVCTQPARFGSWHGNTLAKNAGGGMQGYMNRQQAPMYSAQPMQQLRNMQMYNQSPAMMRNRPEQVAVYQPYTNSRGYSY